MTPHAQSSFLHFTSKISPLASHKGLRTKKNPILAPKEVRQEAGFAEVRAVHAASLGDLPPKLVGVSPSASMGASSGFSK